MIYWSICAIIYDYVYAKLATWVKSSQKVGEGSIKPLIFTIPHYFYIYNISSYDFDAIQTTGADIYIFTTETLYKFNSRTLLPPSLRTGKFTIECPCPELFRLGYVSVSLWSLRIRLVWFAFCPGPILGVASCIDLSYRTASLAGLQDSWVPAPLLWLITYVALKLCCFSIISMTALSSIIPYKAAIESLYGSQSCGFWGRT